MSAYDNITNEIRELAAKLLAQGEVDVVIGYKPTALPGRTQPAFAYKPKDAREFVFNPLCVNGLPLYLTKAKPEISKKERIAIVAKGCDVKNIVALQRENQIRRDKIKVIGVVCKGVVGKYGRCDGKTEPRPEDMDEKCRYCDVNTPRDYDYLIGEKIESSPQSKEKEFTEIDRIEKLSPQERWKFWEEHFKRCIKCYACSKVCPLCYCNRCIVDKTMPRWIDPSSHARGNFAWNIIRAQHLAGRCTGCGECERSCPMDIPLMLLNKKLERESEELFGYRSGYNPHDPIPLAVFREEDDDEFVR